MLLPHQEQAYIPPAKLLGYLLSETHPIGRAKASFFRMLGFDETNVDELEEGLLAIAHRDLVVEKVRSAFGTKYVLDGLLSTPTGNRVKVRTVWIIEDGYAAPRFVTAYPD